MTAGILRATCRPAKPNQTRSHLPLILSALFPCLRQCVWSVESGTRVEERGQGADSVMVLHHPNGTSTTHAHCKRKPPAQPAPGGGAPTDPCKLGWAHAAPMEACVARVVLCAVSRSVSFSPIRARAPTPLATRAGLLPAHDGRRGIHGRVHRSRYAACQGGQYAVLLDRHVARARGPAHASSAPHTCLAAAMPTPRDLRGPARPTHRLSSFLPPRACQHDACDTSR